jgi:hypothetical protein
MKKSIVLISILLIACVKNNKTEKSEYETDSLSVENNSNLIKDEEGITDFVIVNKIPNTCEQYYLSILKSSKSFLSETENLDDSIKQNGGNGLSIKLETIDQNIKYIISEIYPDKSTVINTYIYNPKTEKLNREDYLFGTLEEIDFDQNLLNKNGLNCDKINK